ncbi:hypothetical protein NWE55_14740 [Myroides albus]|uniref:hypothetical protein n=1 Tax=Myroides albus TaxID=2562892 RepID=UPI0021599376|nr:hypothetical protein [Myroides albus]UVD79369.1 hypothetical protein NWE55_14740 [Myroides albus]
MKLITDWNVFKKNVSELIVEGNEIVQNFDTNKNYEEQKEYISIWHTKILNEFESSFEPNINELSSEIKNAFREQNNTYNTPQNQYNRKFNFPKDKEQENRENNISFKNKLESLLKYLSFYLKFLSASDSIIYPELIELNNRDNYSTENVLNLILEKLYILYDTNYISINSILNANGIKLSRHGEERELTKVLEKKGLINVMSARDVSAQLTIQGKMYVEEKQKTSKSNYEKIDDNQLEFEKTIDQILLKLEKLGYGQQIIFEEIEELKDLHSKLNKKNFGQVLKGKLIDLALSKAIENDTISYIYNKITDEILKLP